MSTLGAGGGILRLKVALGQVGISLAQRDETCDDSWSVSVSIVGTTSDLPGGASTRL